MRTLCLNQTHYMNKILKNLYMQSDKHRVISISLNKYNVFCSVSLTNQRIDQRQYQQTIKSLIYMTIHTWLDIVVTLNWLSQYLSDSAEHHEYTFKKLLWYIRSIINLDIMYSFNESQAMLKYSDFNYVLNKQDQKSILECVYMLKDESVLWTSQKQRSVVILITEIKYIIMSMCMKTEIWLEQMLRDISMSKYLKVNSYYISIQKNEAH